MSGFQFPPPPPPPPKASWTPENQYQQSETSGRGRGRGRGRGQARGSDNGNRGRGGRGGNNVFQSQNVQSNPPIRQQPVPSFHGLPPGAYINPAFQGNVNLPSLGQNQLRNTTPTPSRTLAGHKRKLDALRGSPPLQTETKTADTPTAPSVPSFGAPIGLRQALPPPLRSAQSLQRAQPPKRATNALGLTPHGEMQYSSSESDNDEEDVDEEAMFAEAGASLTFEHNGTVLSLKSAADLAAWKEERARNYPTRTRMAAKLEEKRQLGVERKRLLFEASRALRIARRPAPIVLPENKLEKAKKELATQTESLAALRKKVAKSEAKLALAKANAGDLQAAEAQAQAEALGLPTAVPVPESAPACQNSSDVQENPEQQENDEEDALKADSAQSSSSEDSSIISSDSSDSDDDGPPEEVSSKQSNDIPATKKILCRDYVATGRCRDGESCRFKHELPERGTGSAYRETAQKEQQEREQRRKAESDAHDAKLMESRTTERKSIFQRLVEQEHVGEDLLALRVIKALGKAKFFAQAAVDEPDTKKASTS